MAKTTSLRWKDYLINIVDTPGHADFGGEVERILGMVDGVVLLVDINEGVMAQTKFVVKKALKAGLRPIVVFNKVDRCEDPQSVAEVVTLQVFDLFDTMGANNSQLDFPIVYSSARNGWAINNLTDDRTSMAALLDAIVKYVPKPAVEDGPFRMVVTMTEHSHHFGTLVTGRVLSGTITSGTRLRSMTREGQQVEEGRVLRVMARRGGMELVTISEASAGDVITVAGFNETRVSHTLADPSVTEPLPTVSIDPPTLSMFVSPNTSPLAGQDGTQVTASHIGARLVKEAATNVSIIVRPATDEAFEVCGRGPLQMGILIENMRREGFELTVSRPRVLFKIENGVKLEPMEELTLEVDNENSGALIENLSLRKGELITYDQHGNRTVLVYQIPARGLLGFQHQFIMETRGTGVMHHLFHSYVPYKGEIANNRRGVLVSTADGTTTTYALGAIEPRGILFIGEGESVYAGAIIGEHAKAGDLDVNPVREKKLTNIRAAGADEKIRLSPPRLMTLEAAIAYINDDELVEVTPKAVRLRKKVLDSKRRRTGSKKDEA
eukprot:c4605_g1_i2.p1 GENE.c4605_g1_i2~~c4605_g1_i2.p1  ORF type:complete len:646 (+),score=157.63 c4605_g1_i2:285-1940(+)